MAKKKATKKPCYEVSYIKITYGKDGKVNSVTVKVSKAKAR